jgi:hypothetical protein
LAFEDTRHGIGVLVEDLHVEARADQGARHGLEGHKPAPGVLGILFDGVSHDPGHAEFSDDVSGCVVRVAHGNTGHWKMGGVFRFVEL